MLSPMLLLAVTIALPEGSPARPRIDVTYSIPKNYSGFLILAFNMPGGVTPYHDPGAPIPGRNRLSNVIIEFDETGIARYGYDSIPHDTDSETVVERETGTQLSLYHQRKDFGQPVPARGVMRTGGEGIGRKGRRDIVVEVFLVGNPTTFPETLIGYKTDEINRLLLKHFGLPLPEKKSLENPKANEKK